MADQWRGTPAGDVDLWRDERVPAPSRSADGGPRRPSDRRPHSRRPVAPARGRGGQAALLLIGLPLIGAGVDEMIGPGVGLVFTVCAALGTAAAAALVSRAGWWWVLSAAPPVVLATTAAAELVANSAKYRGSKALATGAARWTINGFPVMLAALGAALVVVLARIARDRGNRRG